MSRWCFCDEWKDGPCPYCQLLDELDEKFEAQREIIPDVLLQSPVVVNLQPKNTQGVSG